MKKNEHNLWYKDAIIYQLHIQSFFDSNDDGTGDINGLISKLDYIQNLGVTALWLLPFYPSPLKDGGYDISDFTSIRESYGKLANFKRFVREAHKRGLKVITELVLNHTSNEHEWFKKARKAKPGSSARDFYVWSDNPTKYNEARIIFKDFENSNWSYDPVAEAYYWHRFYSHQPDLNYDNPRVQSEMIKILDFWFKLGVDGLRLDAVPYLYEREGTNCENLPETHEFLKKLRKHIDEKYEDKMLLAEANQWPEDASEYFGKGDECHMAFHFPVMPRLFMGVRMEDRFPIIDILEQTPEIPENCQWAIFLRNHDELTLEMVTDEERDYMYKSFAREPDQRINLGIRRRLAPLLEGERRKIELMNMLLFSLPGTPIVYYGDEIGMGDNYYLGDRYGVRTPMQWTSDKNAGFSKSNPQKLFLPVIIEPEYHYEAINVENQDKSPSSLLWWMRRVIAMRKKYKAFSRGSIEFINSSNPKVLAFVRKYKEEIIMVVVNLSRYTQVTDLDLSAYEGYVPKELFSRNDFPQIEVTGYTFPMKLKDYFWFKLYKPEDDNYLKGKELEYDIHMKSLSWNAFSPQIKADFEEDLVINYLYTSRWFRGKAKTIRTITVSDNFSLFKENNLNNHLLLLEIEYVEHSSENYILPVSVAKGEEAVDIKNETPQAVIAKLFIDNEEAIIYDSTVNKSFQMMLLNTIAGKKKINGRVGYIEGIPGRLVKTVQKSNEFPEESKVLSAEQSNSAILYEEKFFLKLYRAPEEGYNPEIDIIKNLTERTNFKNFPPYAGELQYSKNNSDPSSIGVLTGFISNEGNAWEYTQTNIDHYFDYVLANRTELHHNFKEVSIYDGFGSEMQEKLDDLTGPFYTEMMQLLGKRTAEMHQSLLISDNPDFEPEPFSLLYQKSVYQSVRTLIRRTINDLRSNIKNVPESLKEDIELLFDKEKEILKYINDILTQKKLSSVKSRVHGDYHLGQVLFTGKDFIIIDFEGEPARTISARKLKYCPLKDVAGMLRSIHYAVYQAYFKKISIRSEDKEYLGGWLEIWYKHISNKFIEAYIESSSDSSYLPKEQEQVEALLNVFILEKAVYEIGYEINNRPEWTLIPLRSLVEIVNRAIGVEV
jgi:maltose alpha-D-glucosyltransferase / alpha-amylase